MSILSRKSGKIIFLLGLQLALWTLPYLVPVKATVSLSYVVGYSNLFAQVLFASGAVLFALLCRGVLAREESVQDGRLQRLDLLGGMAIVACGCFLEHHHAALPRSESSYALDRLQMLASGLRPYRDFEFIYGPLHLWIPYVVSRVCGLSVVNGYYVWWYTQWLAGAAMLWVTVALLPYRLSRRRGIFWFALAVLLFSLREEGTAYTPVRLIGAAFCLLTVSALWSRTHKLWVLWLSGGTAILLGLGISPEQGLAVAFGLVGWLTLRAVAARRRAQAALGMAIVAGLCILPYAALGVFQVLREFAGGAYQLPLSPSPATPLLLLAYVAAACAGVLAFRHRQMDSAILPLVLSGFATLPAVLGRTDLGHLMLGSGAFLLGLAYLESRPAFRRWWSPLLLCFLILLPLGRLTRSLMKTSTLQAPPPFWYVGMPTGSGSGDAHISPALHAPCRVIFRSPTVRPSYDRTAAAQCLDPGYFAGLQDVLTTETIERKAAELTKKPLQPLLLRDIPLSEEFQAGESHVEPLRGIQDAVIFPKIKHKPLSYDPIIQAIEENYTAGEPLPGGLRVWVPKPPLP